MIEGGPYRKQTVTVDQLRLSDMQREIKKMDIYSIQLPENIREGDQLEIFKTLLEAKSPPQIKAEDIVLYSITTGILKYTGSTPIAKNIQDYYYTNRENPTIELTIRHNKNIDRATIISLTEKNLLQIAQI